VRLGSRGDHVKTPQARLGLTPDGLFGPKTDVAVRAYQGSDRDASGLALVVDGFVGFKSWASLLAS